jgi:hypothetical protein
MTFFILLAQASFFLFYLGRYNHLLKKWLISHILILLLLIPWLIVIISLLKLVIKMEKFYYWMPSWLGFLSFKNLFFTFKNFSIGYNATMQIYIFATILFFLLFIQGISRIRNKETSALLASCLFIPILMTFSISKWRLYYVDRYFIPSSIFFYLGIAYGLSSIKRKFAILSLLSIITLSSLALKNYYNNYLPGPFVEHIGVPRKKDYRGAANYIAENYRDGDIIFHTCWNTTLPFKWYFTFKYNKLELNHRDSIVLSFPDDSNKPIPYYYKEENSEFIDYSKEISVDSNEKVWLIFSSWDFKQAISPDSTESKVVNWMDRHYVRKVAEQFDGIIVYLYVRR